MNPSDLEKTAGRYAYDGLDRIIHEKARLSIIASLAGYSEGLLFNELKELCSLTDGNLSRHLAILQEADLVQMWKGTRNKRPQTLARLTEHGRRRFLEYVTRLERVVADASQLTRQPESGATLRPRTA